MVASFLDLTSRCPLSSAGRGAGTEPSSTERLSPRPEPTRPLGELGSQLRTTSPARPGPWVSQAPPALGCGPAPKAQTPPPPRGPALQRRGDSRTSPRPGRRFPNSPDLFPASLGRPERRRRRLPRGAGPAPTPPPPPPPRHSLPRGLESQIPVPPSSFLSARLPGAATVAGRRLPASQLVPAPSPSSPPNKQPSPRLGSPDRPLPPSARRVARDSVKERARAAGRAP